MTYPGVRRANKKIELDRTNWADRTAIELVQDVVAPGLVETEMLPFKIVYEGYPDFSYGVELMEGEVLEAGDFPFVNAGVSLWDQTFPETGALPRVQGATLFMAIQCTTDYRLRFRFLFQGTAFKNPNLLAVSAPVIQ